MESSFKIDLFNKLVNGYHSTGDNQMRNITLSSPFF